MKTKASRTRRRWGVFIAIAALFLATGAHAGDITVGEKAPQFRLLTTGGTYFDLEDQVGRPVILVFWSTWCSLDREELSFLAQINRRYPEVSLAIVASDSETPNIRSLSRIRQALNEWNVDARILVDRGLELRKLYTVNDLPTGILISSSGRIVFRRSNFLRGDGDTISSFLDRTTAVSMFNMSI